MVKVNVFCTKCARSSITNAPDVEDSKIALWCGTPGCGYTVSDPRLDKRTDEQKREDAIKTAMSLFESDRDRATKWVDAMLAESKVRANA